MISTYTLNHFGIVSGICKELKIAEIIDSLILPDSQQKVTTGQAVVSMIINGLGFSNRRLYLYPQFFEKKPVELLIGKNISADALNDDTIGRALDKVFTYGCTELFCCIAYAATQHENVDKKFGHLDSTTFSVHGEYKSSDSDDAVIRITNGRSKAKRPDLKQIFLNLLVSFDGGIPLFMQALDGNSSDSVTFRRTVSDFKRGLKKHLQDITYLIADSKFYCKETLNLVKNDLLWISRVPDNITEAKGAIEEAALSLNELKPLQEGYLYKNRSLQYGDIKQRWLVVHSKHTLKDAEVTIAKNVEKEFEALKKQVKKLKKKEFYCKKDARVALHRIQTKSRYHTIRLEKIEVKEKYANKGRPSKSKRNKKTITYFPHHTITPDPEAIALETTKKAIFIVATNELSKKRLSDREVFCNYKGQQKVEKGFRFLKDPLFFASSLFLKKPERIVALTMVMCLSLLVYSIGERKLRKLLKTYDETIENQIKKPTQRPTLRWIFQLFEDVHLVKIEEGNTITHEVKNLRPDGEKALRILGHNYMEPYLLT